MTDRGDVIAEHTNSALIKLAETRAALTRLDDQIGESDQAIYELGTGHRDVHTATVSLRVARDHVQSAWRSLDYATRNLVDAVPSERRVA